MTIKSRLQKLEQRAAPIIKAHNTIRLYWIADHPGLDLVPFDDFPSLGVLSCHVDRIDDPNIQWDMSGLTVDQLDALIKSLDGTFDDMLPLVQREMIAYIRAGEISFHALVDEFNEAIATEAFRRAGVKP